MSIGNGGYVPDPASDTYPLACLLSGDRLTIRLTRFLGQFFVLSDVWYLDRRDADTLRRNGDTLGSDE